MKRTLAIIIAYFPIIHMGLIVLANLFYVLKPEFGAYLANNFGIGTVSAILYIALAFRFRLCSVSRVCAVTLLCFALLNNIPQMETYNTCLQILGGIAALIITLSLYVKKFPNCPTSLTIHWFLLCVEKMSCLQGLKEFERERYHYHKNETK